MSIRFDGAVVVVATLAAFSVTFFAVLLVLGNEPAQRRPATSGEIARDALPGVGAPPPVVRALGESDHAALDHRSERATDTRAREVLEGLGVLCAPGVECYPD